MEWIKRIFKKEEIKDIDDDFIKLGEIEDDTTFIEDDTVVDREPQEIRKNWLRDWMIWGFFLFLTALFIYFGGQDFKIAWPDDIKKQPEEDKFEPVKLDWQSQIIKEIQEKKNEFQQETKVAEKVAEKHEEQQVRRIAKKPRKKEVYGPFKRYGSLLDKHKPKNNRKQRTASNTNNDDFYVNGNNDVDERAIAEQTRNEIRSRGGNDGFDRSEYMKSIMEGINGGGKEKTKTLNEQLDVKPLKKVYAELDTDLDYQIFKGTKISAILNEHMSTDLSGFISAIIDHDVYSSNGEKLIIPAGSIATGRYSSGLKKGIKLVFTVWEDIRTSCGANINLKSPGTSPMGLPGQQIDIDYHFVERFGSSLMLSLVNAVVSTASGFATSGNRQAVSDVQSNFNKSSEIALQDSIGIKPTGYAQAGQSITIMVGRNLNFKNVFKNGEMICQ